MDLAIIGQGYVGRSIAEASVAAGHSVVGLDTDASVISSLKINLFIVFSIKSILIYELNSSFFFL